LREAGIEPRMEWVLFDVGQPDVVKRADVTAVIGANEPLASAAIDGAKKSGLRVPEDISVVACGHQASSGDVHRRHAELAMVMHPLARTIATAVEMLLDLVEGQKVEPRFIRTPYTWRDAASVMKR
jgi:DNA-binding LacI/PurR family transcriptional regulator